MHPRDDVSRPQQGVFSTRSPDRPNPIGLHRVEVASIDGCRVSVRNLDAVDGTPIVDIKPVLSDEISERLGDAPWRTARALHLELPRDVPTGMSSLYPG